ncbi:PREDICTED: uncharacterized protein LOC104810322 isoform X2 [Tarenaya hassleriana]|uniref:uncharacterized protein LOC104810322 isoform X2 n=1 Tax=Tarenaya hassleriana TaxID=28532 RepID=UPI00053C5DD5|nr:PREDICTED: uncharacterized protein LOC104810322 isoform X2 [Tarenaya hassleriana]
MVFSSAALVAVADASADTWQRMRRVRPSERINSRQVMDLACCFPLHQVGRLFLCLWTFLCLPTSDSFYSYTYHNYSSSSSSSDYDDDDDDLDFGHNYYNYGDYADDGSSSSSTRKPFCSSIS